MIMPMNSMKVLALACCVTIISMSVANAEDSVRYNRDVQPILAEHCFVCHGFDKGHRKAGLRLDSAAGATEKLESGSQAIVPGKPDES